MNHTFRLAGLLVLVLVVLFLVVPRVFPTKIAVVTKSRFQNTNDAILWANQPLQYANPSICGPCHYANYSQLITSKHATVSCETCHGAGESHINTGSPLTIDTSRELCGSCHAQVVGRPQDFPQIDFNTHGGGALCITCHNPHNPFPPAGTTSVIAPTIPQTLEGRTDCLLCHAKGGLKPFPDNHQGRTSDTCLACHKGG